MRRVVVVGAGFFGGHVARRLRDAGIGVTVATRRGRDLRMDVEDETSIRSVLRPGDVVVDTAGPFASRTTRLLASAMDIGCDVIDIAEALPWVERVLALRHALAASGTRVYPACSAVAAVAAACVVASGISAPASVDLYLAPASAETASPATVRAFLGSLGLPIRVLRDGRLVGARGYAASKRFPATRREGGAVESAAAALLPLSWPSLRRVDFWVDPNAPLAHTALALAVRSTALASLARAAMPYLVMPALGRRDGEFAVRIADEARAVTFSLAAPHASYLIAVEPSVIVAESLARGAMPGSGVILSDSQVAPDVLFRRLRELGISIDVRDERLAGGQ